MIGNIIEITLLIIYAVLFATLGIAIFVYYIKRILKRSKIDYIKKEIAREIFTEIWRNSDKTVTSTDNSICYVKITYEKFVKLAEQYGVEE